MFAKSGVQIVKVFYTIASNYTDKQKLPQSSSPEKLTCTCCGNSYSGKKFSNKLARTFLSIKQEERCIKLPCEQTSRLNLCHLIWPLWCTLHQERDIVRDIPMEFKSYSTNSRQNFAKSFPNNHHFESPYCLIAARTIYSWKPLNTIHRFTVVP